MHSYWYSCRIKQEKKNSPRLRLRIFQDYFDPRLSRYLSTLSSPQSSFTTGMVAGTSNWKVSGELWEPVQENNWALADLIASLVAQWTEAARRRGGSPEAACDSFGQWHIEKLWVEICVEYITWTSLYVWCRAIKICWVFNLFCFFVFTFCSFLPSASENSEAVLTIEV